MTSFSKRIAVVIDTLARPQGGVSRIAVQSVVVVLATSMALCTGHLSIRDPGGRDAGQRIPS